MEEVCPGAYPRKIDPWQFLRVFLESFLTLAPGLRSIAARHGHSLGTFNISTLSYALGSRLYRDLALKVLGVVAGPQASYYSKDLVVLDSMAVSLPRTRRHNCVRMNNQTVGGGVLWAFCLTAPPTLSPLRILQIMEGSWHDGTVMQKVRLVARGPLYIMDRGFYIIDLLGRWMNEKVRFLVRVRARDLVYTELRHLGDQGRRLRAKTSARGPRRTVTVLFDGIATLGKEGRRGQRPTVRLLVMRLEKGEKVETLILASSELETRAQQLLDLYGRRWEVEEFHRLLKRSIGLAHLYSFRQRGIEMLLTAATLLALLLWLSPTGRGAMGELGTKDTIPQLLRKILRIARLTQGITEPWRPNTIGKNHWRHRA